MKQLEDKFTQDMLGDPPKRGRGRPKKIGGAMSDAERARRYRARQKHARANRLTANSRREIRYRGPNGETWTGFGLPPKWLDAACKMHHCDRSAFRINGT